MCVCVGRARDDKAPRSGQCNAEVSKRGREQDREEAREEVERGRDSHNAREGGTEEERRLIRRINPLITIQLDAYLTGDRTGEVSREDTVSSRPPASPYVYTRTHTRTRSAAYGGTDAAAWLRDLARPCLVTRARAYVRFSR